MADRHIHLSDQGGASDSISVASRHYLASQHLWACRRQARLCVELENSLAGRTPFHIEHRSNAMGAVLSAVTFLETLVNEVFQDAADGQFSRINTLSPKCIS